MVEMPVSGAPQDSEEWLRAFLSRISWADQATVQRIMERLDRIERSIVALTLDPQCAIQPGAEHQLTMMCPLSCLESRLSKRPANALRHHLWADRAVPLVADVVVLIARGELSSLYHFGAGSRHEVLSVLAESGLAAHPGPRTVARRAADE